jgi:hypothetical protein
VIVSQLTSFGGEAQICNRRNFDLRPEPEAVVPLIFCLVLDVESEVPVLEVGEAKLGRKVLVSYATGLVMLIRFQSWWSRVHTEQPASSFDLPSFSLS